jgi:nucleotide-binding universal stress UspA family protein
MRNPSKILVATDFSASAERALDTALEIAARSLGEVHLVHALELPSLLYAPYDISLPNEFDAEARRQAEEKLAAGEARVRARGLVGASHLGSAPSARCVAERANEIGADLVVVGSRGRTGWKRLLLGSVAELTVKESPVSVLTVRGEGHAELPRVIVAGVDFSASSEEAVALAADWARTFGAQLHLVHGVPLVVPYVGPYEASFPEAVVESVQREASERLEALAKRFSGVDVKTALRSEAPFAALDNEAARVHADLIVTGSRGLGGIKHAVLGSVAERTLRHAPCSVLTVKGKR